MLALRLLPLLLAFNFRRRVPLRVFEGCLCLCSLGVILCQKLLQLLLLGSRQFSVFEVLDLCGQALELRCFHQIVVISLELSNGFRALDSREVFESVFLIFFLAFFKVSDVVLADAHLEHLGCLVHLLRSTVCADECTHGDCRGRYNSQHFVYLLKNIFINYESVIYKSFSV